MKKIILTIVTTFTMLSHGNAQSFQKSQLDLNIGVGLGSYYYRGIGYSNRTPPLSASLDYGITKNISLGGYLGYTGAKWSYSGTEFYNNGNGVGGGFYNYTDTYSWRHYIIGVRGAFHLAEFIPEEKLDVYGGLMLGTYIAKNKFKTTSTYPNHIASAASYAGTGFAFSLYAGARYRFTEHVGAFAELGYGISYVTLGFNYKF